MTKYCLGYEKKYWFGLIKWGFQPHVFLITNAFYTLENSEKIDVIKSCQYCEYKEAFSLDKETLLETVKKFPKAFDDAIREYLQSWMR